MKLWKVTLVALLATLFSLGLIFSACGDDDDDDDDDDDATDDDDDDQQATCNIDELCNYIVDTCENSWGWAGAGQCIDSYLTGCAMPTDFMDCACICMDNNADCNDAFVTCESNCWTDHCTGG